MVTPVPVCTFLLLRGTDSCSVFGCACTRHDKHAFFLIFTVFFFFFPFLALEPYFESAPAFPQVLYCTPSPCTLGYRSNSFCVRPCYEYTCHISYGCRFSMYGHTHSKRMDQPAKVANPARVQLNGKKYYSIYLSAILPENLVSRDGFGSPVPRQPAHSPYSG